jgi:AbrB family looped-hinge helix DNA binding protein
MSTLKLHYEGWLALPAGLRQKLGLKSGDRLEAELAGGAITLRPAGRPDEGEGQPGRTATAPRAGRAKPSPATARPPAAKAAPPSTRRAARQPAPATLPPVLKSRRGRRKAKETGEGPSDRS